MTRAAWPFIASLLALAGCPRELAQPELPADATPCVEHLDCAPSPDACGVLPACVHGFCEEGASREVPCPE